MSEGPPDVGLFDYHRSRELIEVGRETGRKMVAEIREALEAPHSFRERLARWIDAADIRTRLGLD